MNAVSNIRSLGLSKVNHLVKAAARYQELQPAFADWAAGEVYVCKKTGDYRYRFGEQSKSIATWNTAAREIFAGPEELAFAAMVLAAKPQLPDADMQKKLHNCIKPAVTTSTRANIIAMATGAAA
jgi:hypothetical protein